MSDVPDVDIQKFRAVLKRLDAFLTVLLPLLDRNERDIARNKARAFVLAEAKPGPFDNVYRWDADEPLGSFSQFLDCPRSQEWRDGYVTVPIGIWCDVPMCRQRIQGVVPGTVCEAARNAAETLLDFVTDRHARAAIVEKLQCEALDYLECRGVRVETDADRLDRYLKPQTALGRRIVKALWFSKHAVTFATLVAEAWQGDIVQDGTVVRQLKRVEARWFADNLDDIDLEISAASRTVKLNKLW